jgi:hypothetical protein
MNVKEVGNGGVIWNQLSEDRLHWQSVDITVIYFRILERRKHLNQLRNYHLLKRIDFSFINIYNLSMKVHAFLTSCNQHLAEM